MQGVTFVFGQVEAGGKAARVTPIEYAILQALVEVSPQSMSTTLLQRRCTNAESRDSVRVHVANIRRKLKENGVPLIIEVRWGFGYRVRLH